MDEKSDNNNRILVAPSRNVYIESQLSKGANPRRYKFDLYLLQVRPVSAGTL